MSGLAHDGLRAQLGKSVYGTNCAACHGPEGKGNQALGAPDLGNKVWLHGGSEKDITATLMNGRNAGGGSPAMPAHKELLGEAKVHLLAAYVWGLSRQERGTASAK